MDAVLDVVGALDVDWTSLMSASAKPTQTDGETSDVLERFSPANVLARLGVSKQYAGEERTARVNQLLSDTGGELLEVICVALGRTLIFMLKCSRPHGFEIAASHGFSKIFVSCCMVLVLRPWFTIYFCF